MKYWQSWNNSSRQAKSSRNHERAVDDFAREKVGQVLHGAWGTDVQAGVLGKIGRSEPWIATEKKVMRAALIAETGAEVNVHPGRHLDQPQEVADFIRQAGHSTERVMLEPHRSHHLRRGAAAAIRASRSSSTCSARRRAATPSATSTCRRHRAQSAPRPDRARWIRRPCLVWDRCALAGTRTRTAQPGEPEEAGPPGHKKAALYRTPNRTFKPADVSR